MNCHWVNIFLSLFHLVPNPMATCSPGGKPCVKVKCISIYKNKREKSIFEALRAPRYLMLKVSDNSPPLPPPVFDNGQATPTAGVMIREQQCLTFLFCLTRICCVKV